MCLCLLGVQMLCKMCAKEFQPYGRDVTCSPECSYQLKLQSHRAWWQRSGKFKRDKYAHYLDNKRRLIAKRIINEHV